MSSFQDRVVMITGAAGNLGQAVARAFESAGAKLVLVDRAPDRLPRLFPEMVYSSDHYLATGVDLIDPQAVAAKLKKARAFSGAWTCWLTWPAVPNPNTPRWSASWKGSEGSPGWR